MSTFITGSNGFIGTHLKDRFDKCVCVPHKSIFRTDWASATKVFFLSTYGNMSTHTEDREVIMANVIDLSYVLASVDWKKIESFVFLSTSSVKLKRQTMYSRSKKAAEELLLAYMEKYDAPITIIRPLSVTGVGEQKEHLIPKLIDSCLNGTEMDFVPLPKHDFIDVEDLVDGIINLSDNKAKGIFELGNAVNYSNAEVKDIVETVTESVANVHTVQSMRDYDNDKWIAENFKARGWGWVPKKSLTQSITEMVNEAKNGLE